jgi:dihydrofolate reductase
MRCSVFIAVSLDGFIAREDGDIDWLERQPRGDEDYGYTEFFESIDAIVMGRGTFEKVMSFPEWPYKQKRLIVLSQSLKTLPIEYKTKAEVCAGPVQALVNDLSKAGHRRIYVDGGKTIQSFLSANLITDLIITRIPILLGRGIPLFGPVPTDIQLSHVATRSFSAGYVQSEYRTNLSASLRAPSTS